MHRLVLAGLACLGLAGCAAQPQDTAQQADTAACTAQANAQYRQNTLDLAGRTAQNGLMYGATPNRVFDAETMGALHQRDSQITRCERTGNTDSQPEINNVPVVPPHIIGLQH